MWACTSCYNLFCNNTRYVSKGSYTLVFTQPKNFQSCTCLCSHGPSPHPPSIFGSFSGSFASICSRPSGVPITSPLFLAAFEHVLHLFVFITSLALPVTHHLYATYSFSPTQIKLVWILFGLHELIPILSGQGPSQCSVPNWNAILPSVVQRQDT